MNQLITRGSLTGLALALTLASGACLMTPSDDSLADDLVREPIPGVADPVEDPLLEPADDELDDFGIVTSPGGEVMLDVADMVVLVGDEVRVNFSTRMHHIDPAETYVSVVNAPDTAEIDLLAGTFSWIPEDGDIGVHVLSFDLWYETEDELLDAQRLVIEVVPANSLIEVGI